MYRADIRRSLVRLWSASEAVFSAELTDANVLARMHRAGLSMGEVGVQMPARSGGESMHGGLDSAIYAGKTLLAVMRKHALNPPRREPVG